MKCIARISTYQGRPALPGNLESKMLVEKEKTDAYTIDSLGFCALGFFRRTSSGRSFDRQLEILYRKLNQALTQQDEVA